MTLYVNWSDFITIKCTFSGIISRLEHLVYLRVQAVILGSVMKAASLEDGHDILDFMNVDPVYGNLDDLRQLIHALHEKGNNCTLLQYQV